ncbi:hypothetical protein Mesci_2545 [Mesorhizobium ciceri biovar biserrulae WSM1271]|uniref:Uncharacterized protein n=1 Tax=Mesorhizobium ciceri biovar biserrulae (strain HAMBI 2942 / LMG 23838 / WSM1271) TaxID=765698 RepID=E8TNC9_MESCW|nr:hypothetical protein Mesci_2545 [Mesorhizobium ciceri biovar biserrulae WSM1271]
MLLLHCTIGLACRLAPRIRQELATFDRIQADLRNAQK